MGISPNILSAERSTAKPYQKDLLDVTADYVNDKWSEFAKVIYTVIDVLNQGALVPESQQETFGSIRKQANLIKLAKAPGTFVKNINTLRNRTVEVLTEGPTLGKGYSFARALNDMISPIHDIADFFSKAILFIPVSNTLKGINGLSIIFGIGCSSIETGKAINAHRDEKGVVMGSHKKDLITDLLKLANQVSLLALGVLIVLSAFFSVAIPSVAFLATSTTALVFSILGYYQENLGKEVNNKTR